MPILSQGYESYRGSLERGGWPFLSIAREALRRNSRWWVWLLFAATLLIGNAWWYIRVLVVYGGPAMIPDLQGKPPPMFLALTEGPEFYPDLVDHQFLWALVLGTVIGAGEIAEDLRSGALAFYLGRPLTRRDYVLGKVTAVSAAVFAVTLVPALLLFAMHASFEANFRWVADHARIPFAILGSCVLEALFISCFVLGLSALASRRRWATVLIAGVFLGLVMTSQIVAVRRDRASQHEKWELEQKMEQAQTPEEARAIRKQLAEGWDELGSISPSAGMRCISPWGSYCAATRDLFGLSVPSNFSGGRHWFVLAALSVVLAACLLRRVRAVEVVT